MEAQILIWDGKVEQAEEIINSALEHKLSREEKIMAQKLRLGILSESADLEEIRKLCLEIIEEFPEEYFALHKLCADGKILPEDSALLEKYENIANKITGLDNPHENLFYALANGYHKLRDYKKAAKYLKRANAIQKYKSTFNFEEEERIFKRKYTNLHERVFYQ